MEKILIFAFLIASAYSQEPFIACIYDLRDEGYTAIVSIYNDFSPPFNGFTNCPGFHAIGFGNENVTNVEVRGITPFIPSVVCAQFPNILHFQTFNVSLSQIQNLSECRKLITLNLSGNLISELRNEGFSNNRDLEVLNLSKNLLTSVHEDSLYNLHSLRVLNLANNPGIDIPSSAFKYLENLHELYLDSCGINVIEDGWFINTTLLEHLYLSHNPLAGVLPTTFANLRKLLALDLSHSQLQLLPTSIFNNNPLLNYLNLESNNLQSLNNGVFRNQTKLATLGLSNNILSTIGDNVFTSLQSLRNLHMNNCNLRELKVEWFKPMTQLRTLSMQGNLIEVIPYGTFAVENLLEVLILSRNNLTVLDATSFADLSNLRVLRVDNNQIGAIDNHFLSQPRSLDHAFFERNECVDVNIERFYDNREHNLKAFSRCFNNFEKIPIEFETQPNEEYRWFSMRRNTLVVQIKASSSAQIILSNQNHHSTPSLEIHIGMNRNWDTYIYENSSIVWDRETPYILNGDEWTSFVISWNYDVLTLYEKGFQLPLAMHIIKNPFAVNFFGIRSASNAAWWRVHRIEDNFMHDDFPGADSTTTTTSSTSTEETSATTSNESTTISTEESSTPPEATP